MEFYLLEVFVIVSMSKYDYYNLFQVYVYLSYYNLRVVLILYVYVLIIMY